MELCFYNAVLGGMSADGKRFSYTNRLATSGDDTSMRSEWFTCACCPPNIIRLLGSISGYMWTFDISNDGKAVDIKIHMYGSGTLTVPVGNGKEIKLYQKSNWPWEGKIQFNLESSPDVKASIALRVPGWASSTKISPSSASWTTRSTKGYIHISADQLAESPGFTVDFPMSVRELSPHPFTNQDIIALARGPIVYCVEDADNSWVENHFKVSFPR
jgi:DUF1680 family protein